MNLSRWRSTRAPMLSEAFTQPELIYEKGKFSIGAIDYYCQDIINIAYAEGEHGDPACHRLEAEARRPVHGSA